MIRTRQGTINALPLLYSFKLIPLMQTVREVINCCPLWLYRLEILVRVFSDFYQFLSALLYPL